MIIKICFKKKMATIRIGTKGDLFSPFQSAAPSPQPQLNCAPSTSDQPSLVADQRYFDGSECVCVCVWGGVF